MTPEHVDLWRRIEAFDFDGAEPVALSFSQRLARENDWEPSFAARVLREYRRFVFLAITHTHPVSPSDAVDQAWHLHLTYTRSYWHRLCNGVLGKPLHHEPTRGGPAEAAKHHRQYQDTLATYRRTFGEEPPSDIWPSAETWASSFAGGKRISSRDYFLIRKRTLVTAVSVGAIGVGLLTLTGCDGVNPFAMKGAEFFFFLFPMMAIALAIGCIIRNSTKVAPNREYPEVEMDWADAAYLAGGKDRLATAAIAHVTAKGWADVSMDGSVLRSGDIPPTNCTPIERAVLDALPMEKTNRVKRKMLAGALDDLMTRRCERLQEGGLMTTQSARLRGALGGALPIILVLLLFGVPRLVMGMNGDKPSTYLVFALLLGGFGALKFLFSAPKITDRGATRLAQLRREHSELQAGTTWNDTQSAALAVALFGTVVLSGSMLSGLGEWYPRKTDGSSCGTGCGGGGGCSGGGGCGGCGGGD